MEVLREIVIEEGWKGAEFFVWSSIVLEYLYNVKVSRGFVVLVIDSAARVGVVFFRISMVSRIGVEELRIVFQERL